MQNFDVPKVLQEFHHEFPFKLIEVKEIVELSNSQANPSLKKQKIGSSDQRKKQKKTYENTRKFQTKWNVAKLPWAKGVMVKGGFIHVVKCRV